MEMRTINLHQGPVIRNLAKRRRRLKYHLLPDSRKALRKLKLSTYRSYFARMIEDDHFMIVNFNLHIQLLPRNYR